MSDPKPGAVSAQETTLRIVAAINDGRSSVLLQREANRILAILTRFQQDVERARDAAIFDGHARCLEEAAASRERERAARVAGVREGLEGAALLLNDVPGKNFISRQKARLAIFNRSATIERLLAEEGK